MREHFILSVKSGTELTHILSDPPSRLLSLLQKASGTFAKGEKLVSFHFWIIC